MSDKVLKKRISLLEFFQYFLILFVSVSCLYSFVLDEKKGDILFIILVTQVTIFIQGVSLEKQIGKKIKEESNNNSSDNKKTLSNEEK